MGVEELVVPGAMPTVTVPITPSASTLGVIPKITHVTVPVAEEQLRLLLLEVTFEPGVTTKLLTSAGRKPKLSWIAAGRFPPAVVWVRFNAKAPPGNAFPEF